MSVAQTLPRIAERISREERGISRLLRYMEPSLTRAFARPDRPRLAPCHKNGQDCYQAGGATLPNQMSAEFAALVESHYAGTFSLCSEPRPRRIGRSRPDTANLPEVGAARGATARPIKGQDLAVHHTASNLRGAPQNPRRRRRGGIGVSPPPVSRWAIKSMPRLRSRPWPRSTRTTGAGSDVLPRGT